TGSTQDVALASVGVQLGRQNAGLVRSTEHHRTGAVTKQHAGPAIIPVKNAGEDFGTDDQGMTGAASAHKGVRRRQGIDEAAAYGLDIERSSTTYTQIGLHQAGRTGENEIRRGCRDKDQVELFGPPTCVFQG